MLHPAAPASRPSLAALSALAMLLVACPPPGGPGEGEACSESKPCAEGFACVEGSCRAESSGDAGTCTE